MEPDEEEPFAIHYPAPREVMVRHRSTSTADLFSLSDSHTHTAAVADHRDLSSSYESREEEETELKTAGERTGVEEGGRGAEDRGQRGSVDHGDNGVLAGERNVTVDVPLAVENLQIIQRQETNINNIYVNESVEINWNEEVIENIVVEKMEAVQKNMKQQDSKINKEIEKIKSTITERFTQLLRANKEDKERMTKHIAELGQKLQTKQKELTDVQTAMMERLTQLEKEKEEEKRKEKDMRSVELRLGERQCRAMERSWDDLMKSQSKMKELVKRLYAYFNIKLKKVAVGCGLQFVLDLLAEQVKHFSKMQEAVQEVIVEEVLPENLRAEVTWGDVVVLPPPTEVDDGGRSERDAGLPPPVQASDVEVQQTLEEDASKETQQGTSVPAPFTFDPTTVTPRPVFEVVPTVGQETNSRITALVLTRNNVLVMADFSNMAVKWVSLAGQQPSSISSLSLKVHPWDLAWVGCDVIAVTSGTSDIILLKMVSEKSVKIRQIHTASRYTGVTSEEVTSEEPTSQGLVVSSMEDRLGPAVVDYVNGHGVVLWTILSRHSCPDFRRPCFLLLHGREVLISDQGGRGKVMRVDMVTGEATSPPLTHPHLSTPPQLAVDPAGNLYLSSSKDGCVLLCSPSS